MDNRWNIPRVYSVVVASFFNFNRDVRSKFTPLASKIAIVLVYHNFSTEFSIAKKCHIRRRPSPTPSVTPTPVLNQCSCNDKNIWLDVYFLIDASFAMTSAGFDGATAFVESVLFKMTLGQAYGQQSRVGFITYAADANKRYDLTSFRSTDDMINNADLTYDGTRGTNIEAAIQLASTSFDTSAHRDNAQKVIVIVASDYQKGSYNDPTVAAETFKEDGGYIITSTANAACRAFVIIWHMITNA
ncbi:von Willebrand factor type A domain protein [Ancylostoma ceylanicum]|uniref:von Willebrand factor type A domain protein n=1 Tax=Ancylostoma ceylanicum TaxID=53326 RepID=A0A0D6M7G4_9BILA|nr:von Willebrand factor type A domain protein [Ancylostoma ceylanicum]